MAWGTWRRYKLGQAQFTAWLKQTADKFVGRKQAEPNLPPADPETDAAPQQSRRQKKKSAAAATASVGAGAGTGAGLGSSPETDKSVHWSELEVLAQRVADNAEPDDVPESALNILRDVINLRKKSFNFFSKSAEDSQDEKVRQSNANHAHIIDVLERVLAKLEALVRPGRKDAKGESRGSNRVTTSDLTNLFALLDVQPATDGADGAADGESGGEEAPARPSERPQKGKHKKVQKKAHKPKKPGRRAERATARSNGGPSWIDKIQFRAASEDEDEDENDEFDLYMMVYCFFEDFNAIRNYVAERWCDYWYERSVSLDTLAVITNAAFELFHQLEWDLVRELSPLHPELARYEFMMNMLFIQYGIDHIDYDSYDGLSKEEHDERIWRDESDWLALFSCFTLQRTLESIPPGKVPMLAPSQRRPPVYGATSLDQWNAFESSVTMQLITEGALLKALKTNQQEPPILPAESQLLLDFEHCLKRNDYTSALIFSLHLWVDIRNIIETDHVRPFEQLQTTAARLKQALQAHNPTEYCRDRDFKRQWIARSWETQHYMLEDFTWEDKRARFRQIGIREDPDAFFLLKHEPVWAGLLDLRAKLVYSQLGHEFVRLSCIVDAAAYLYHAALAANPTLPRWERMAAYVDTHADDSRFRRGLRAAPDATSVVRNFAGIAADRQSGRNAVAPMEDDGPFVPAVAVRQSLYQRYAFDDKSQALVDYVDELYAQRCRTERRAPGAAESGHMATAGSGERRDDGGRAPVDNASHGTAAEAADETERDLRRRAGVSQLSPIEMLQLLDETVTAQVEGLLTLDYFKLFDESAAMLEAVVAAFGPEVRDRLGHRDGGSRAYLERLPIVLGEDLQKKPRIEAKVMKELVTASRDFLLSDGKD